MEIDHQTLTNHALSLPDEKRAALAASLLQSLETSVDHEIEESWRQEVATRIAEIDRGEVEMIPWDTVISKMRLKDE